MPKSVFTGAYKSFLGALRAARQDVDLSQTELAKRLGKEQPFVSLIERGVRRLDVIEFCVIAKAMGYDPTKLFDQITKQLPDDMDI